MNLVHKKCTSKMAANIIYSSFYALSLEKIRRLEPEAEIGILDEKVSDCLFRIHRARMVFGTPVSGKADRNKAGSGRAGTAGNYGRVSE